ncbi:hypothetical protein [Streptomyces canus]|uniref:hypothetical protein n=1 Tax=Streptomyces canus TaxID=58343 RepID=UPI0009A10686|nr:hypothetical protein [Streptomyces canus]
MSEAPHVRHAERADLPAVSELAVRHAEYERAAPPPDDLPDRLAALLFDTATPRRAAWWPKTPVWNDGAIRFYDRMGARARQKVRYSLPVAPRASNTEPPQGLSCPACPSRN